MSQHPNQPGRRAPGMALAAPTPGWRVPSLCVSGLRFLDLCALGLCVLGLSGCRTPDPGPQGPTDPRVREDPDLGLRIHTGSVLEGLPEPERGLDGGGRR